MAKCIMVVDDDPIVLGIVKGTLEKNGYKAITSHDGNEALEMLKEKLPDLILLDVQMPQMDGYAFIIEKSKIPAAAEIPVIVLSAFKETEPLFMRHGVKAYLVKPIDNKDMLQKIKTVLND